MRLPGRLGILAGILVILIFPARADFADGVRAYDSGDYTIAFAEWHPLARQGDPAAQIAIASLYREGLGRDVNLVAAARWYRLAAEQGDAIGQMNLGEMYQRGWGVKRDLIAAFIWYDRAAQQGRDWAAGQRDRLAKEMTEEALKKAKQRLKNRL